MDTMITALLLSSFLTFAELNCENLFDCRHDSAKQDTEFLPEAGRHWTPFRYWRKLDNISRAIVSCCDGVEEGGRLPDMVALCEVENDSVMNDLTRRSALRTAGYEYLMTSSADRRGIDVALLYSPFSFAPIRHYPLRVTPVKGMLPTRDILYVAGRTINDDTLHIFVCHAPSRYGGERNSRPHRLAMAERLCTSIDSLTALSPDARIIVAGDLNDYDGGAVIELLRTRCALNNVTRDARGRNGAKATYRYKGLWGSLDHILVSGTLMPAVADSYVNDAPFLLEEDTKYGGVRPRRTYNGFRYSAEGTSDHLPLVVRFRLY